MKYKNASRNNEYFQPADFLVGSDVRINGYSFHILGCDEFTRKWYVENFGMRLGPNIEE
jgi:EF-hand domain-containing protein 1